MRNLETGEQSSIQQSPPYSRAYCVNQMVRHVRCPRSKTEICVHSFLTRNCSPQVQTECQACLIQTNKTCGHNFGHSAYSKRSTHTFHGFFISKDLKALGKGDTFNFLPYLLQKAFNDVPNLGTANPPRVRMGVRGYIVVTP